MELPEMNRSGIAVAEYWTELPPKAELERKVGELLSEAKERLERRRSLPGGEVNRKTDYFLESDDKCE